MYHNMSSNYKNLKEFLELNKKISTTVNYNYNSQIILAKNTNLQYKIENPNEEKILNDFISENNIKTKKIFNLTKNKEFRCDDNFIKFDETNYLNWINPVYYLSRNLKNKNPDGLELNFEKNNNL